MANLNKVMLIGNLTADPDVRTTPRGTPVTELRIAVNRVTSGPNEGERREEATYLDVTCWGRTGEIAAQYLAKGRPVFIEGRLQQDTWEDKPASAAAASVLWQKTCSCSAAVMVLPRAAVTVATSNSAPAVITTAGATTMVAATTATTTAAMATAVTSARSTSSRAVRSKHLLPCLPRKRTTSRSDALFITRRRSIPPARHFLLETHAETSLFRVHPFWAVAGSCA